MPIAIVDMRDFQDDPGNPGNPLVRVGVFLVQPGSVNAVATSASLLSTDTPAQMVSKLVTAVVNAAATEGFTLARTDVLLPSFVRGS